MDEKLALFSLLLTRCKFQSSYSSDKGKKGGNSPFCWRHPDSYHHASNKTRAPVLSILKKKPEQLIWKDLRLWRDVFLKLNFGCTSIMPCGVQDITEHLFLSDNDMVFCLFQCKHDRDISMLWEQTGHMHFRILLILSTNSWKLQTLINNLRRILVITDCSHCYEFTAQSCSWCFLASCPRGCGPFLVKSPIFYVKAPKTWLCSDSGLIVLHVTISTSGMATPWQ